MKFVRGILKIFFFLVILTFVFAFSVLLNLNWTTEKTYNIQALLISSNDDSDMTATIDAALSTRVNDSIIINNVVNNSVLPFMDEGQTWKDPFCDEFLSNKFSVKMTPCDPDSKRVLCYGSPFDDKMGSCFIHELAMDPVKFHSVMSSNRDSVQGSNSLWLVRNNGNINPCTTPIFDPMEKYMVGGDYVKRLAKTSILSTPLSKCDKWINGTTFVFMGFDSHIYFKYLSWFSLHNGIINYENHSGKKPSLIIRIPEGSGSFTHADYEKKLFSETTIMSLGDFSHDNTVTTCFEDVIITPWAYSTSAFRCKMADAIGRLRNRCYNCNSRGLPGTRYSSFRRRALAACSIPEVYPDPIEKMATPRKIVLEIRKPYMRHDDDDLNKFHRTLVNHKELLNGLKKGFPGTTVQGMIAEDLSLCDQIKMVHDADVLLGVHGAGLVHLWWLQDHALLFEMVPLSQLGNPSFKMLSTLTGKRYHEYRKLKGSEMEVIVNVGDLIHELKKHY